MSNTTNSLSEMIKDMFGDLISKVENAAKECAEKEFFPQVIKTGRELYESWVGIFYASYSPLFYERCNSLYDYFEGHVDGTRFTIGVNPGGGLEDYLFDITMKQGYHGGADSGPGHPSPGTPHYRVPQPPSGAPTYTNKRGETRINGYFRWGSAAASMSFSPFENFWDEFDEFYFSGEANRLFESLFQKYMNNIAF